MALALEDHHGSVSFEFADNTDELAREELARSSRISKEISTEKTKL